MELTLKVTDGANTGKEIKVPGPKFVIGRGDDCQIRAKSDMISRRHCEIILEENRVIARDNASRNGTYVNDEKIVGDHELKNGDRLRVGPLKFEVVLTEPASKKRPKVKDVKDVAARTAEGGGVTDDEVDINAWLESESGVGLETRALMERADVSETVLAVPVGQASSGDATQAGKDSKVDDKSKPGTKSFGKLPPVPQHMTKNSREAAAETLKKLFKSR